MSSVHVMELIGTNPVKRAMVAYASMLGALVLARAVDDAALSDEILHALTAAWPGASAEPLVF